MASPPVPRPTRAPVTAAHLRHEYRTPVNHIMGYSELLIEEARERHLEVFIPVFQRIHDGARELLDSIENAFGENGWEGGAFREKLNATARELSQTLSSLAENLECAHRETIADLDAISGGIRRVRELTRQPADSADRIEDLPPQLPPIPARIGGGKILIADDDEASRNLLRRRLEREDHQVVEARDGREALQLLKDSPCDLVLLDILMPIMDGFETLARLKQDAALRELPVIMISALDELQGVVRCIEMGAEDYLPKPFNRVLLRARISASLEKKWLRDRERQKTDELERTLRLLEQAHEQMALQASRDALTGLANRRTVENHLDSRMKRGTPFTAIYIDLNGFKKINDTYGHAAGDDLLKQVANRLLRAFRAKDVVGRWGGDEFVALMDPSSGSVETGISRIAECLTDAFVVWKDGDRHGVFIGAAVGVATWNPGDTATELLHRADFAMYEEKLRRAG